MKTTENTITVKVTTAMFHKILDQKGLKFESYPTAQIIPAINRYNLNRLVAAAKGA
jgi:hypothetical protein